MTETGVKDGNRTELIDDLDEWWSSEPDITLSRSDWSVILETLSESAAHDDCGDHIDQMAAKEKRKIIAKAKDQATVEPPIELTRARYQESVDDE